MADNNNMQDMLKQMSQQLNLSENELKSAAKKGNANSIFKNADSKTQNFLLFNLICSIVSILLIKNRI